MDHHLKIIRFIIRKALIIIVRLLHGLGRQIQHLMIEQYDNAFGAIKTF
jgi:hypothetical protein